MQQLAGQGEADDPTADDGQIDPFAALHAHHAPLQRISPREVRGDGACEAGACQFTIFRRRYAASREDADATTPLRAAGWTGPPGARGSRHDAAALGIGHVAPHNHWGVSMTRRERFLLPFVALVA